MMGDKNVGMTVITTPSTPYEKAVNSQPATERLCSARLIGSHEKSATLDVANGVSILGSGRGAHELLATDYTLQLDGANATHRLVVAGTGTVTGGLGTEVYDSKIFAAHGTGNNNRVVLVVVMPKTLTGAESECVQAVMWNTNLPTAVFTCH